jgi:hypothetical protein
LQHNSFSFCRHHQPTGNLQEGEQHHGTSDYIQARNNPQETRVTIDGQLYLPFVSIDLSNNNDNNGDNGDLVQSVMVNMLQLPNIKKTNAHGNSNDNGHNRQPFE